MSSKNKDDSHSYLQRQIDRRCNPSGLKLLEMTEIKPEGPLINYQDIRDFDVDSDDPWASDLGRKLDEAADKLSSKDKELFVLFYKEGRTLEQLADQLSRTVSQVKISLAYVDSQLGTKTGLKSNSISTLLERFRFTE